MKANYILKQTSDPSFDHQIELAPFVFSYDNEKLCTKAMDDGGETTVIIYGRVMDSRDPNITQAGVASALLKAKDTNELIDRTDYLAGRFIIVFKNSQDVILLPDATSSVPVFYSTLENKQVMASRQDSIADTLGLELSERSLEIKRQAEEQQPLPYDLSMYDEMKVVLPNHYLDVKKQRAVRFFPQAPLEERSMDDVIRETITLTQNVVDHYMSDTELIIPLTAGKDSRLILSFFKAYQDRIKLYTFDHEPSDEEPADIKIPRLLTDELGLVYHVFPREKLDEKTYDHFKDYFSGTQNRRILENALTLNRSEIRDKGFVTGDIIPIVKSNFGKKLPEKLATTSYLVTKTHNYSKENRKQISQWLKDVREQAHLNKVSIYDLFFWEMRLGRWLPNNMSNYDTMSDPVLIFNNRRLIKSWISIPREKRVETDFHEQIIRQLWPELLDIPLTSGSGLVNDLTSHSYVYYVATYFKYYMKKFRK